MTKQTTIVVLSYNGKAVTEKFIELLFKYTKPSAFNLIMIDNGSTDGAKEYLTDALSMFENHTLVINDRNLGVIVGVTWVTLFINPIQQSFCVFLIMISLFERDGLSSITPLWKKVNTTLQVPMLG